MKIMMLSAYFPPEIGSASHLYYDLGREFVGRGHEVTVLTGYPSYHVDRSTLDPKYDRSLWMTEQVEGLTVVRIRVPRMPRAVPVLRGIEHINTSVAFAFSGLFLGRVRPDVLIIYSPPLFLGLTGILIRVFRRARVILNIQDLFPQQAIDLGLMRSPVLIAAFRRLESYLYRRVNAVAVHSSGNREHILRFGGAPDRLYVVPNVVDTEAIRPGNRDNEFRRRHNISPEEVVVSFAGVLGYNQDLDTVIEAAQLLKDDPAIRFYIVGDGVEKPRLMQKADGLPNVRFLPMISKEEYTELLHASDIGLVTLRARVQTPVVPSKILSIMASGTPIVAALPLQGDAPAIIGEARCGISVEPENAGAMAEAVRSLAGRAPEARELGMNGRRYAEEHFSLRASAVAYERIFENFVR